MRCGKLAAIGALCLSMAFVLIGKPSRADTTGPILSDPDNGHYYEEIDTPDGITWWSARDAAAGLTYQNLPGHLVTITSDSEQQFILNNHLKGWTGGYKDANGVRHWVTNESFTYQHWTQESPKAAGTLDQGELADYLQTYGPGIWNDRPGSLLASLGLQFSVKGYIVEYEPSNSSAVDNAPTPHEAAGIFRPATGQWIFQNQNGGVSVIQWGAPGDIPVPADYLGLGNPQIAVYRPSTGEWFIGYPGGYEIIQWGGAGDIPAPADYMGTGHPQIAVFRPSTFTWYIRTDNGQVQVVNWGWPGHDVPVVLSSSFGL